VIRPFCNYPPHTFAGCVLSETGAYFFLFIISLTSNGLIPLFRSSPLPATPFLPPTRRNGFPLLFGPVHLFIQQYSRHCLNCSGSSDPPCFFCPVTLGRNFKILPFLMALLTARFGMHPYGRSSPLTPLYRDVILLSCPFITADWIRLDPSRPPFACRLSCLPF